MSLILKYNKYIGVPILSEWLKLNELVDLCSALCNKVEAKIFASWLFDFSELFSQNLFSEKQVLTLSYVILEWCTKYGLNCSRSLHVLQENFHEDKCKNTVLKSVQRLKMVKFLLLEPVSILHSMELHELTLSYNSLKPDFTLLNLRTCCFASTISDASIRELCINCTDLTTLTLGYGIIGRVEFQSIAIYARKLQHLDLSSCKEIGIDMLIFHCKSPLLSLKWPHWKKCFGYEFHYLGSKLETLMLQRLECSIPLRVVCPNLTDLYFGIGDLDESQSRETITGLPLLKKFDGCFERLNHHSTIVTLATASIRLETLILYEIGTITDDVVNAIANNLSSLTTLRLVVNCGLTNAQLIKIASRCPNLTTLEVSGNENLSDESFLIVGECCRNLKNLNVARTKIGDDSLLYFSQYCKRLAVLRLEGCMKVTDKGISAVVTWLPIVFIRFERRNLNLSENVAMILDSSERNRSQDVFD